MNIDIWSFIYNLPDRSKFAVHLLESHHSFDSNNFNIPKIIPSPNIINLIDTWEHLEIYKAFHNKIIVNEQLPDFNNPLFHKQLIIQ